MSDVLFLLRPGFPDAAAGPGTYYCPPCATITGLLTYFPALRQKVEVREVDFPRPRADVAALLGPNHPGCPVLVLAADSTPPAGIPVKKAPTGHRYIDGSAEIGQYLAALHGVSAPHP